VSFVVEELKAVFDPRGGQWMEGRYVPSLLAAIGEIIEKHMIDIGFIPAHGSDGEAQPAMLKIAAGAERHPARGDDMRLKQCPKCGSASLTRREGCDICLSCGYSRCG
jgi:ribonucleoside-diphosphate reductase alpha chain